MNRITDYSSWPGVANVASIVLLTLLVFNGQIAHAQNVLPVLDCSLESTLKSLNADTATSIDFVNQTLETVHTYWLDYNGQRVFYESVPAGNSFLQTTFVTHPWIVIGESGKCYGIFSPTQAEGEAIIAPTADLSITGSASSPEASSGAQIVYTIVVSNGGPADETGVLIKEPIPVGTTFAAASASQGQVVGAVPGGTGVVTYSLGTVARGATAVASFTANVFAPGGSTLVNTPSVTSNGTDPNPANNVTAISTPVFGGAVLELLWDQPTPTAANPTPAPENLRVVVVGRSGAPLSSGHVTPQGSCSLVDVNVYKSDQPSVQTIPSNLWQTVPPDMLQATMAAAPSGSFYVITNVWNCGGTIIESGPSNEASVPAGPSIAALRVTAKLKVIGSSFKAPAHVLVNGVGFVKKAAVQGGTTVVQKGLLADGTSIKDIGTASRVLITVQNADGGLGTITFKRP
jgi:uncharacterized repeat protein (TIGR01451 family)